MSALDLDRVAPTRRPEGPAAGTQKWRNLLFVHFAVAPEIVRAMVPEPLELDLWDDRAHVGVVPFEMKAIRSSWMPRFTALDFLETNVRTYVHFKGEPGVFFFSLEASSWLAVKVARTMWGLPYFHAVMSTTGAEYHSARQGGGAKLDAKWTLGELLGPSKPGTYEHFVLERYLLFSTRGGQLRKGQVHHAPYPAQRVTLDAFEQTLFPKAPDEPFAAHFASGVDVEVFGPWRI